MALSQCRRSMTLRPFGPTRMAKSRGRRRAALRGPLECCVAQPVPEGEPRSPIDDETSTDPVGEITASGEVAEASRKPGEPETGASAEVRRFRDAPREEVTVPRADA